MAKKNKAKKSKSGKPVSGLLAGLVNAGLMSEKEARATKREQRKERKAARKQHGQQGVEELEAKKREELEAERRKAIEKSRRKDQAARKAQRKARIEELRRRGVAPNGRRRFYFVRPDQFIDFVDVDDSSHGGLCRKELAITAGLIQGDPYRLLPTGGVLDELRKLAPELVIYPSACTTT